MLPPITQGTLFLPSLMVRTKQFCSSRQMPPASGVLNTFPPLIPSKWSDSQRKRWDASRGPISRTPGSMGKKARSTGQPSSARRQQRVEQLPLVRSSPVLSSGALPDHQPPWGPSPLPQHFPSQHLASFPSWTEMYWFLAKFNYWCVTSMTGELCPSVPPLYSVPRIPVPNSVCMGHRAGVRECLSDECIYAFSKASGLAGEAHSF